MNRRKFNRSEGNSIDTTMANSITVNYCVAYVDGADLLPQLQDVPRNLFGFQGGASPRIESSGCFSCRLLPALQLI